jgi:hypothetical protein
MKTKYFLIVVLCILSIAVARTQDKDGRPEYISEKYDVQEVTADELLNWDMWGSGRLSRNGTQLYMAETEGSAGVLLISPTKYGKELVVSYDVLPLQAATVLVALMSFSNTDDGGLAFEDDYNANLKYINQNANAYMIAFLDAPHNRYPFINRFPARDNPLIEADETYMQPGVVYHIDVGREKDHIWLAINGAKIIDAVDPDPLGDGHFSFRIRGTGGEVASCLIKNVRIYTK